MSRKLRIEYPGAMYHVMNRGDQREDIFRDDQDRQKFLCTLGQGCAKTEWQVHAFCLIAVMSLKWIAERLHMGSWTYVSNMLNEQPQSHPQAQEVLPLCQ
jgi:hypothetical protein